MTLQANKFRWKIFVIPVNMSGLFHAVSEVWKVSWLLCGLNLSSCLISNNEKNSFFSYFVLRPCIINSFNFNMY